MSRHATSALALLGLVLVGCSPEGSQSPTSSGGDSHPSVTSTSMITLASLTMDRTAGGQLTDVGLPPGLPPTAPGQFYWIDPFGNVWATTQGERPGASVFDVVSGRVTDYGTSLRVGQASSPRVSGVVGERVLAPDGTVVWQARDEGGDLAFDSFDIAALVPGEAAPVIIGASTPDVGEMALSAPGDGNYLTVAGDRAWWVDGEARVDASTDTGLQQYSSVYSAPVGGSSPQVVAFLGARFPAVDQCAPAGTARLTYLVDGTSTGEHGRTPEIHAATLDARGAVVDDSVIWRGTTRESSIDSVGVCGDLVAVGYSVADTSSGTGASRSEVSVADLDGSSVIDLGRDSGAAGRVTATRGGVFFFAWGDFKQFFWSRSSREAFFIGWGSSFGFGVAADGSVVTQQVEIDPATGEDRSRSLRRMTILAP